MSTILEVENLHKSFGKKEILKGLDFEVSKGEIVAFIGPNGSGKTTTIKLILGLQSITKGSVKINGFDVVNEYEQALQRVGNIVENPDSYMYLSGYKNLELIKNIYPEVTEKVLKETIELVGLSSRIHDKVSKYSLGMKQRLGIAKALLINPNLLILDEPTNGLDPEGIRDLRVILKKLAKKDVGILISSHNLSELESFCNKVLIIEDGKITLHSKVKELINVENVYKFKVNNTESLDIEGLFDITKNSFKLSATEKIINETIRKLVNKDIEIYEVRLLEITLEEAFFKKTGGKKLD